MWRPHKVYKLRIPGILMNHGCSNGGPFRNLCGPAVADTMPERGFFLDEDIMGQTRTRTSSDNVTRRGFLRIGAGSVAGWSLAGVPAMAKPASNEFRCIFLNLVGGPSHLDTWDPKPEAPAEYRGPFRAIRTKVPGVVVTELFPRLAGILDKIVLVRSVYHEEAPIHESGFQLIQTGQLVQAEVGGPHVGRQFRGQTALVPGPLQSTGVRISQGQDHLDLVHVSHLLHNEPIRTRDAYGDYAFGRSCLIARQLIERNVRCVTVNMFDTVYDRLSWDCHHDGGSLNVGLDDYRDSLGPMFDKTYTALILDLERRGLLGNTLVVAAGEFGRSPKLNLRGGRDHWTGAWTVLFAGGGMRGGQVLGSTDRLGREPRDRPVHASAIANTVLHAAGLPWHARYRHGEPLRELLGRNAVVA
jgi:hypothetical protein